MRGWRQWVVIGGILFLGGDRHCCKVNFQLYEHSVQIYYYEWGEFGEIEGAKHFFNVDSIQYGEKLIIKIFFSR